MKRLFTYEDDEYIKAHYKTMPYAELAEHFGVTERQLRGHINNMGWTKQAKKDDKYFACIDSAQKAYWLGLMYADGYLSYHPERRTYEVAIELQDADLPTLEAFRKDLGLDCVIYHKEQDKSYLGYDYHTSSNLLRIYSRRMCEDLIRAGVGVHKTYSSEYPVLDDFHNSFVRGFLDGDGCIYIAPNTKAAVSFTNANEAFLIYLREIIHSDCGADGRVYCESEHKYRLVYYNQDSVRRLLDWIYQEDDGWRMERKYKKYEFLRNGLAA